MTDAPVAELEGWTAEGFGDAASPTLVVLIHGGNWRASVTADSTRPLAAALADEGHRVWNLEYPRAGMPGGGWPGTGLSVRDALRAARRQARDRPLVVVGHSAGGHLALWAAKGAEVDGVVSLAGIADLAEAADTGMREDLAALLGGDPSLRPQLLADADPMAQLPIGVPIVVVHGRRDPLVPIQQSRTFVTAAQAAGDRAELVELADADHAHLRDPESPAWPAVRDAVSRLTRAT